MEAKLERIPRRDKKVILFSALIAILVIVGMIFGVAYLSWTNKVKVFALCNGDKTLLINSAQSTTTDISAANLPSCNELLIVNTYNTPITLELACNPSTVTVSDGTIAQITTDNRLVLTLAKRSRTRIYVNNNASSAILSISFNMENTRNAYVSSSDTLAYELSSKVNVQSNVYMLNNIKCDKLFIAHPCRIYTNSHSLSVDGEMVVDTIEHGIVEFNNTVAEELCAKKFFVNAINCDIIINNYSPNSAFDFGEQLNYYVYARSFNGTDASKNEKTIFTYEQLLALADTLRYPTLNAGCSVMIAKNISIPEPIVFPKPINISVNGILSADSSIEIDTQDEGIINIESGEYNLSDIIRVSAPNCNLTWHGTNIPDELTVAEMMNVKKYNTIDVCQKYSLGGSTTAAIESFTLKLDDRNIVWNSRGNTIIAGVSFFVNENDLRHASPTVKATGTYKFSGNGLNPDGTLDLTKDCRCTLTDSAGNSQIFVIRTNRVQYNIPIINIHVEDNKEIKSKDEYLNSLISITAPKHAAYPDLNELNAQIRGRGNSTWTWNKKPYNFKLDKKEPLLGMTPAKKWSLLSYYGDKSLIRGYLASKLSQVLTNMEFTAQQYPVDLFINGEYRGVYMLSERIEVSSGRVYVGQGNGSDADVGFLLELGGTSDKPEYVLDKTYFHADSMLFVAVAYPKPEDLSQEQFEYIKDYVTAADKAVITGGDYEKYIDIESVIDWLILHELSYNLDCSFRRSCFFTKSAGGKIHMGPAWDFDLAFGNFSRDDQTYSSWASIGEKDGYVRISWTNYLFKNEKFMSKFRTRWNEVKEALMSTAINSIDYISPIIYPSQIQNFTLYDIMDKATGFSPAIMAEYNTYDSQLQYLKDFLKARYKWMDEQILK